jgi:hypothetical protein
MINSIAFSVPIREFLYDFTLKRNKLLDKIAPGSGDDKDRNHRGNKAQDARKKVGPRAKGEAGFFVLEKPDNIHNETEKPRGKKGKAQAPAKPQKHKLGIVHKTLNRPYYVK